MQNHSEEERSSHDMQAITEKRTEFTAAVLAHMAFIKRLACLQVGDDGNDIAQEVMLAALSSHHHYSGKAPIRAWLLGILKHKVIDNIRHKQKFNAFHVDNLILESATPDMFTHDGSWNPATFNPALCPSSATARQQLLAIIELCMQALPEKNAQIFLMREYLGFEVEEISQQTGLASGHIRVILHRARLKLRACTVSAWGDEYAS